MAEERNTPKEEGQMIPTGLGVLSPQGEPTEGTIPEV